MTSTPSATAVSMAVTRSLSDAAGLAEAALVGRDARPRRHPGDRADAEVAAEDARVDARVAARGRRGVGAVAVVVARRRVVAFGLDAATCQALDEPAGADELVVAVLRENCSPAWQMPFQSAGGGPYTRVRSPLLPGPVREVGLVGEARVLRPDARVDDADDDVLADVAARSAQKPPGPVSPSSDGVLSVSRLPALVEADRDDVGLLREARRLRRRERRRRSR